MVNSLSILGSTGSIGTQTLDVADKLNLKVSALTASTNIKLLEEQVSIVGVDAAVVVEVGVVLIGDGILSLIHI